MTEPTETIEIDEQLPPEPEQPEREYRTLLEIWRALLEPARNGGMSDERVTPQWATRIVSTYQQLSYADTPDVNVMFYDLIDRLAGVLDAVIEEDPDALKAASAEEDAVENKERYLKLLTDWQALMLREEMAWDPLAPVAPHQLAAMSEVHNMFFGQNGLTGHLDSIGFQFDDADRLELQAALDAVRTEILKGTPGA